MHEVFVASEAREVFVNDSPIFQAIKLIKHQESRHNFTIDHQATYNYETTCIFAYYCKIRVYVSRFESRLIRYFSYFGPAPFLCGCYFH